MHHKYQPLFPPHHPQGSITHLDIISTVLTPLLTPLLPTLLQYYSFSDYHVTLHLRDTLSESWLSSIFNIYSRLLSTEYYLTSISQLEEEQIVRPRGLFCINGINTAFNPANAVSPAEQIPCTDPEQIDRIIYTCHIYISHSDLLTTRAHNYNECNNYINTSINSWCYSTRLEEGTPR